MTPSDPLTQLEADPYLWRLGLFRPWLQDPTGAVIPDAERHRQLWQWAANITPGQPSPSFVAIWARGGAKSTSAEMATTYLGATRRRRYVWYVCATQPQADDHVDAIGELLVSPRFAAAYPAMGNRRVGKFGHSKGWRRNRLRTASRFTVDAVGLDTAARGVKLEADRPDLIIFDDVDDTLDTEATVAKKLRAITRKIIPAGRTGDTAVLFIQNLIHPGSIATRLVNGGPWPEDMPGGFLQDHRISGPHPALTDYTRHQTQTGKWVVNGTPTWAGQTVADCQALVDKIGISAFETESQHLIRPAPGGIFSHLAFGLLHATPADVPDLVRVVVWCDPAVTARDESDSQAIQADGIDADGIIWRLFSWEKRATPLVAISLALEVAAALAAEHVGIETDQGGDTWQSVFRQAQDVTGITDVAMAEAKAGAGEGPKVHRAQRMLTDYEQEGRRIRHVSGMFAGYATGLVTLEAALHRFPKTKPLDLVDAAFWSWADLREAAGVDVVTLDDDDAIAAAVTAERRSILATGHR